jgi:ABC-type uncharacterized transport system substrate-binding protein
MKRREFMALLGGAAAAWPLAARAQQAGKVWRIGFVAGGERAAVSHILAGFPQGMRELGYAEGRDFTIEWRFAEGNVERFSEFAAELVRLRVDAIVVATAAAVRAVQQATNTIPIIMMLLDRSGRQRIRCQPRASRRQYHWTGEFHGRHRAQAAGAAHDDRA